jgi:hypothetical protein
VVDYEPSSGAVQISQDAGDVIPKGLQAQRIVCSYQVTCDAIAAPTAAITSVVAIGDGEATIECRLVFKQDEQGSAFVAVLGFEAA